MQAINPEQADAIMDVVDQCRDVSEAYENRLQSSDQAEALQFAERRFTRSVEALNTFYSLAGSIAVRDEILLPIVFRNLPEPVSAVLFSPPQPAA